VIDGQGQELRAQYLYLTAILIELDHKEIWYNDVDLIYLRVGTTEHENEGVEFRNSQSGDNEEYCFWSVPEL
jgi:hypothetical protein